MWCHSGQVPSAVALKLASPAQAPGAPRRLRAEPEAMRPLHHEHLVTSLEWVTTPHGPRLLPERFSAGSPGRC